MSTFVKLRIFCVKHRKKLLAYVLGNVEVYHITKQKMIREFLLDIFY